MLRTLLRLPLATSYPLPIKNISAPFLRYHSSWVNKNNTGWIETTRNYFHPGCIITVLRLDVSGYSPFGLVGRPN